MEQRAFKRIPANLSVKFCCCSTDYYYGIVRNLSGNGMFIDTSMCFPLETTFDIDIFCDEGNLRVPVIVRWIRKSANDYDGVGVEIKDNNPGYVKYIKSLGL